MGAETTLQVRVFVGRQGEGDERLVEGGRQGRRKGLAQWLIGTVRRHTNDSFASPWDQVFGVGSG